ncbi:hypothetical protein DV735_g2588, partial [Chaetothyriales sp. CBS 134920]
MVQDVDTDPAPRSLPFPPLTKSHILACSYHSWHPHFRLHSPKARLVPLSQPFLDYLRADGIVLPPDDNALNDDDGSRFSEPDNNDSISISNSNSGSESDDEEEEDTDPSDAWPEIHSAIRSTIASLGGAVLPKLNWSAPKDATWMSATNDMTCRSANDVYLLLKSSDFITHDLEHAFDDCVDDDDDDDDDDVDNRNPPIPYHLVLRKRFEINPALEFRCFVRNRQLLAISQRDMNHFDFLADLAPRFKSLISDFLHDVVLPSFDFAGQPNFVLDLYISISQTQTRTAGLPLTFDPELRLVRRDDPEAYSFASTKYSAHKLPKDVVDASMTPSAMIAMMEEWQRVMRRSPGEAEDSD